MSRNPETMKEAADPRKARQKANKAVVLLIRRPHQRTHALHRERHRPVQLLLAPNVSRTRASSSGHGKGGKGGKPPRAKTKGRTDLVLALSRNFLTVID